MDTLNAEARQKKLETIIEMRIVEYLKDVLGDVPQGLSTTILSYSKLICGTKDQFIEEAGSPEDGQLLFFESGIAHTFYYSPGKKKHTTTHVTKKNEVLMDINSFIHRTSRQRNVQMLEDGIILSIRYPHLRALLSNYPILHTLQWQFQAENEKQHLYYQHLLKLPLDERIKVFLDDNPGIASRINNDHLANYLGTCRTGFSTAYSKYRNEKDKS